MTAQGERVYGSKLTVEKVLKIRDKYKPFKYTQRKLAKEYGVTQPIIHRILHREIWCHI